MHTDVLVLRLFLDKRAVSGTSNKCHRIEQRIPYWSSMPSRGTAVRKLADGMARILSQSQNVGESAAATTSGTCDIFLGPIKNWRAYREGGKQVAGFGGAAARPPLAYRASQPLGSRLCCSHKPKKRTRGNNNLI